MKKIFSTALVAFFPFFAIAQIQDLSPIDTSYNLKELGLATNGLFNSSYGLVYRTGTQKALWRFNSMFASGSISKDSFLYYAAPTKGNSFSFGFGVGREYRKPISEKFELRYGADINAGFLTNNYTDYRNQTYNGLQESVEYKSYNYRASLGFVVGINYLLGKHFAIGAELNPAIGISRGKELQRFTNSSGEINEIKRNPSSFYFGISGASALLSIVYRFN